MTASVIPGVWDSRTAWNVKWQHFQSLTTPGGIRLPSCQDKYQVYAYLILHIDKIGGV
jgi:hypothetical protein